MISADGHHLKGGSFNAHPSLSSVHLPSRYTSPPVTCYFKTGCLDRNICPHISEHRARRQNGPLAHPTSHAFTPVPHWCPPQPARILLWWRVLFHPWPINIRSECRLSIPQTSSTIASWLWLRCITESDNPPCLTGETGFLVQDSGITPFEKEAIEAIVSFLELLESGDGMGDSIFAQRV